MSESAPKRVLKEFYTHLDYVDAFSTALHAYVDIKRCWREYVNGKIGPEAVWPRCARAAITARVFAAVTLEGFINFYGCQRLGKSFYDNIDRLGPRSKWLLVPRLVTGKPIDSGCQGMAYLQEAFTKRDRIVHPKPKEVRSGIALFVRAMNMAEMCRSLQATQLLLRELKSLDSSVDDAWVQEQIDLTPFFDDSTGGSKTIESLAGGPHYDFKGEDPKSL